MRWAESWIGVSGFLISWASLRATSPQAATFCARMSGVRSSSTATAPGGEPGGPGSGTTVTDEVPVAPVAGDDDLALLPRAPPGELPRDERRRPPARPGP